MKIKFLIILLCLPVFMVGQSSREEENLEKYWRFRERLKNFVVPGDGQGCSLISFLRESYSNHTPDGKIDNGFLNYGDETQRLAWYISTLAMEYKNMQDHSLSADLLNKTKQELAFALRAFNRLDIMAEPYWNYYYPDHTCTYPLSDERRDLKEDGENGIPNGFFIREDVPAEFTNNIVNGNVVENLLNSSYFPVDDGRTVDINKNACSFSGDVLTPGKDFPAFPCDHFNGNHHGPTEESLDQAIQMIMAMAIVAKCVPSSAEGKYDDGTIITFYDGSTTSISIEAQKISERITNYMKVFDWLLQNTVTCGCVKGVAWDKGPPHDHFGDDPCKCFAGGAVLDFLSYGVAMANSRIQTAHLGMSLGTLEEAKAYYCNNYNCELGCITSCIPTYTHPILASSKAIWELFFKFTVTKDDYKVCTLAAIANIWNADTEYRLYQRCDGPASAGGDVGDRWHFPLLHNFLYPDVLIDDTFSETFYEDMLNSSECYSSHGNDPIEYLTWRNSSGLLYGGIGNATLPPSAETDNLSYLFYFNLYNLYKPSYLTNAGVTYRFIEPSQLCEANLYKTGIMVTPDQDNLSNVFPFIESDQKGFHASNSINVEAGTGGVPYVIANDNDAQPWPLSQANVLYEAGNEINLHPGFEVHNGAEFHAAINTNLHTLACSGTKQMVQSHPSHPPMQTMTDEEVREKFNDLLEKETAKQTASAKTLDINISNISITPNPTNGSFQISITKNDKPVGVKEIKIIDMMGKVIWETGASQNNTYDINIASYSGGIYYVKSINEFGDMLTKKLIKQ